MLLSASRIAVTPAAIPIAGARGGATSPAEASGDGGVSGEPAAASATLSGARRVSIGGGLSRPQWIPDALRKALPTRPPARPKRLRRPTLPPAMSPRHV